MKKKILSILLVGILIIGLTGCGNNNSTSNEDNKKASKETTQNTNNTVITCVQLQPNPSFNELSKGTRTIFENGKVSNVIYISKNKDNKSAEDYCNTEGKRLTETFENASYEIEDNNCNIIFNVAKMSDSELEKTTFGKNRDTNTLITKMSYDDYYDYLSSNQYAFCNKGDNVEKQYPNSIVGEYSGVIYSSSGSTYDWQTVTMKFEDRKYTCSYSIKENNYEVVGDYEYNQNSGIIELKMDEEKSKGNLSLVSPCYGKKRVYKNIEGYDLEIVEISTLDEDYQKQLKLNKN